MMGIGKDFLNRIHIKKKHTKMKDWYIDLIEIKNFCLSKDTFLLKVKRQAKD